MARETGTFGFSANFEVKKDGTIDARQIVDNFSDLLNFTADNYIPNGFPVSVRGVADASERGLYLCLDNQNLDVAASWGRVGQSEGKIEIEVSGTKRQFDYYPFPLNVSGTLQQGDLAKNGYTSDTQFADKLVYIGANGKTLNESILTDWKITETT